MTPALQNQSVLPSTPFHLKPIAQRYFIETMVASGGMGTVYRALDEKTGRRVALKLLHATATVDAAERFLREGTMLAEIQHPGIVSYIDHGIAEQGLPYLAMEWLEGEDLSRRLSRGPLSLSDTLRLVRAVADALCAMHSRGLVHRDLKPSNLFLRDNCLQGATILDFGLARRGAKKQSMTQSGLVVGTPEYMAPEQARGIRELTPAVDVFALGCIFYECLTGHAPFRAEHVSATLAKILYEMPTPLRHLIPELPQPVDMLVEWLLDKEPQRRPADAKAMVEALLTLGEVQLSVPAEVVQAIEGVSENEQQLISVLLVCTQASINLDVTQEIDAPDPTALQQDILHSRLKAFGAYAQLLADGSTLAVFESKNGTGTDLAALAARCALSVRGLIPNAWLALGTSCTRFQRHRPVGEVLNRIDRLLEIYDQDTDRLGIIVDDVTAHLLDSRFQVNRIPSRSSYQLNGLIEEGDLAQSLLGKPTRCIGRDYELSCLEYLLAHCVDDSISRAALIVAGPGLGKTRVRHEFLLRAQQWAVRRALTPDLIVARGDPMMVHSPYHLVATLMRRLSGLDGLQHLSAKRQLFIERMGKNLPADSAPRVLEFLCEACGLHGDAAASPLLLRARGNAELLKKEIERAFCDFLSCECAAHPVVLLLDDVQWADDQSIELVGAALRALESLPLLVVAFGRQELFTRFGNLWEGCAQELHLHALNRKSSERLVVETLGRTVAVDVVDKIVTQAAGNPLFLEELIRAHASDKLDEIPETIMSVLQARLSDLPQEARRVLRAASVLGPTFWFEGVQRVLGSAYSPAELSRQLEYLVEGELCEVRPISRYQGTTEYHFRHSLVCDAAYSLITDEDRVRGHRLAGRFLEHVGEQDPLLLIGHYTKGNCHKRAAQLHLLAGDRALGLCLRQDARVHYAAAAENLELVEDDSGQPLLLANALLRLVQAAMDLKLPTEHHALLQQVERLLELPRGVTPPPDSEESAQRDELVARLHCLCGQPRAVMGLGGLDAHMRNLN